MGTTAARHDQQTNRTTRRFHVRRSWPVAAFFVFSFAISQLPAAEAAPGVQTQTQTPTQTPTQVATPAGRISCGSVAEIEKRPLRWRMANLVVVGIKNTDLPRAQRLVSVTGIGGILVRGTPTVANKKALIALRDGRREMPSIVAVDEEGGRVQHLRRSVGVLPSAQVLGKKDPKVIEATAKKHAKGMANLGFTMNFGPVVDLYSTAENGVGDRAPSEDPIIAAQYGSAFAKGMLAGGIYPILKHFPGGGHANGDPHYKGTSTPPWDIVEKTDLVPFKEVLSALPIGVMSGHQRVPGLDDAQASLSNKAITGVLRNAIGFQGLVVTDSLSMWAITYNYRQPEAAVRALKAGNDVLLFDDEPGVETIINALVDAGTADPAIAKRATESNLRILVAKGIALCDGTTLPLL
jgi:beta-N-acetylhexosaminidase